MFRESLAQNEGMLFVFDRDVQCGMWMKNVRFPLDMLWIDRNKKIVDIKENVPPCKTLPCPVYKSDAYVRYVLEVNAGFTDKHNIKTGDAIVVSLP